MSIFKPIVSKYIYFDIGSDYSSNYMNQTKDLLSIIVESFLHVIDLNLLILPLTFLSYSMKALNLRKHTLFNVYAI